MVLQSELIEEILSRNGIEDWAGPIDLRIAQAKKQDDGGQISMR